MFSRFTKERADSQRSLSIQGSVGDVYAGPGYPSPTTPVHRLSDSELSTHSLPIASQSTVTKTILDSPSAANPRLVGLSQPFFATSPPLDTEQAQFAAMERVKAHAASSNAKVRVLVAEDNRVNQEVVLRMLKLEDIYDVTVARDGQEAYDMVKRSMEEKKLFNLIFMDVQMPNLDGLQSTRLIRGMGFSAPIVALTAFAEESNVQECMESGMDFFLPKPIRRPALKHVLKKYCATIPEEPESPPHGKRPGHEAELDGQYAQTNKDATAAQAETAASSSSEGVAAYDAQSPQNVPDTQPTTADPTPFQLREDDISPLSH